ncbi:SET domain-containing protein [Setomelanomma holmii]|uniref:SET domain-containing protein n=1 Tax=Setomelanomma holmii TaxID=210430 RepID=A0A9P4GY05_9PLEO|nr:SET domain-containing protein [Setomelanomma holmii]
MDDKLNTVPTCMLSEFALHKDQTLCVELLETLKAAAPLQIAQSKIPRAGTGLFVINDVDFGQEHFRSRPVVNCVEDGYQHLVCDYCYVYKDSKLSYSGRIRTAEDTKLEVKACIGCKVFYYCSKILTNCLSIYQAEGSMLGTSLDIIASLINHSCDPNAFVVFEGGELWVRPTRKISAGKEITQCYTDIDMDVLIRRSILKLEYFFDCRCARCERQIKSYDSLFPERIEQVKQSQQQLLQLTKEAVEEGNVDIFESKAPAITTAAFPDGHWPEDLAPWPSSRNSLASIHQAHGRRLEALKDALKGQLLLEHRAGDNWVLHLYNLVQHFSHLLMHETICRDTGFSTEAQMWIVMYGYLHELRTCARKTFGKETGYAEAIQSWYDDCVKDGGAPEPITRAFVRRFNQAQAKLLIWAGVEEKRAIALT